MWMTYHKQSEFWHTCREFLIIQKTIYSETTKMAYVKILLEHCWQKGFNVNSYWAKSQSNDWIVLNKQKPFFKPYKFLTTPAA